MSMILTSLFSALIPVGAEGLKQFISSKVGGVKPTTVDEQIKLDNSDIERLKAVASLDNPGGTPSQWVIDLRASARYIAAGLVIAGGVGVQFTSSPIEVKAMGFEAANIAFGFLFGQRIVASYKGK